MAFKMNGWNAGRGTGSNSALTKPGRPTKEQLEEAGMFDHQKKKTGSSEPFKKTSGDGVSTDLIVQGQGESNESYQKRKSDFVAWLQNNAGPNMDASKAQNYANKSNATFDSDPSKPKGKEQKNKEIERIELAERQQK